MPLMGQFSLGEVTWSLKQGQVSAHDSTRVLPWWFSSENVWADGDIRQFSLWVPAEEGRMDALSYVG